MTIRLLRQARLEIVSLQSNAAHTFASQNTLFHYASGAAYTFIPKNACSTMRLSLALANGVLKDSGDIGWIHDNNRTFNGTLRDIVTAPYAFVVLRCPWTRLASTFLDKMVGRQPEYHSLMRRAGDRLNAETLTFRSFVDLIGQPKIRAYNIHWRRQVDFLMYEDYDDWFTMADIPAMTERLRDRIGLEVIDARGMTGHGTDSYSEKDHAPAADLPAAEIVAAARKGRIPAHHALYDEALRETVKKLYADDLALYREKCGEAGLMFPAGKGQ